MFSRARKGSAPAGQDEAEGTALLSRLESVSKDPATHPASADREEPGQQPQGPGRRLALLALRLALLALALALGYAVLFCAFWAHHARSPASYAAALRLHSPSSIPLMGADFGRNCSATDKECQPFLFGLATAPAHVEDDLHDSWLDFARQKKPDGSPRVVGWQNVAIPEQRLRFWSEPEVEVDLAAATGIGVLRLGVDWGRIVPTRPPLATMGASATLSVVDWVAVERYKRLLSSIKARGIKTMVTLFHHSFPKWGLETGGWLDPDAITLFTQFASVAAEHFGEQVDYWVTFNEPQIFVLCTHCWCSWPSAPPGRCPSGPTAYWCTTPWGLSGIAMRNVAAAHNEAYTEIKQRSSAPVGVAHSVAILTPFSALDMFASFVQDYYFLFLWIDNIVDRLDFCGLNYYGQEFVSLNGLHLVDNEEYSEAGRAVYPDGLYKLLTSFHARYRHKHPRLRYMVTENGIADADDHIRRLYLLEHLASLHAAMQEGVPVDAYIHWTISDNWEWSDGYCPKFGLVEVQRDHNLTRVPRPSYHLYKEIVSGGVMTAPQRQAAWENLHGLAVAGGQRPICKITTPSGLMGSDSLSSPIQRNLSSKDWRFGVYQHASTATMFSRALSVLWNMARGIR